MKIDVGRMDEAQKMALKEVIEEKGGAESVKSEYMTQKELIQERR